MWSEGIYEGPHSFPQNFPHKLAFAQKYTLITSLSEFISVSKQPTSSVVFPVLYECYDDSLARQSGWSDTYTFVRIKITIPMFA